MSSKMIVRINTLVLALLLVVFAMNKIEQGSLDHFLNAFFGVEKKQQQPQVTPTLRRAKIIKLPQDSDK